MTDPSQDPVRIAVLGASGRMGRAVIAALAGSPGVRLAAAVVRPGSPALGADAGVLAGVGPLGVPVGAAGPGCFVDAAVVIDFSLPDGLLAALGWLDRRALVTGTTGGGPGLAAALDARAQAGAVLAAANFSLGIAVLAALVAEAARALPHADVEIVEAHHRRKRDAPSGTALALADAVDRGRGAAAPRVHGRSGSVGERPRDEVGVHAVRGGDVVGEHAVWLLLDGERLALSHAASSRETFANGAVAAGRWIAGRSPGRYSLSEVLGLGVDER